MLLAVLATSCAGLGPNLQAGTDAPPPLAAAAPVDQPPGGARATEGQPTPGPAVPAVVSEVAEAEAPHASAAPPAAAPVERSPVVLGFAGDTAFTAGTDVRDPLGAVAEVLSRPDLMVVNLETAVADPGVGTPADKEFVFRSPPASLDLLVAAGVDVVTLANNHVLDHGAAGVAQTLDELDRRGLGRVGAGVGPADAYRPLVVPVGEWSVGVVSLSRVPCDWSASGTESRPQVAWACPAFAPLADAAVRQSVETADVTVVMVHGGTERAPCPDRAMGELVTRYAGLGADLIVNSHPHVLQGLEQVGDTVVVHSTGNFAFPSAREQTARSAVFLVEVSEGGVSVRVEPVDVDGGIARPATGGRRQQVLDLLSSRSFGWSFDQDGTAEAAPGQGGECGPTSDPSRSDQH